MSKKLMAVITVLTVMMVVGCSHNPYIRARQIEAGAAAAAVGGIAGYALGRETARPAPAPTGVVYVERSVVVSAPTFICPKTGRPGILLLTEVLGNRTVHRQWRCD